LLIKQYDNTVQVGIEAILAPAAKNAASKNHPKDVLCNKKPPLRNSTSPHQMLRLKQENIFGWLAIEFFKKIINA